MTTPRVWLWLGLAVISVFALAGCRGGGDSKPTPTSIPSMTATATDTIAPPRPTTSPTGTSNSLPEALQEVAKTVVSGDADAIRAITMTVPTSCGGPAECPNNGPAGTYPIIRAVGCEPLLDNAKEGGIDETLARFGSDTRTLLAVFEETQTEPAFGWVPRGSHVVVVWWAAVTTAPTATAFHVREGQITGIEFGCGFAPENYYQGVDQARFLFGPVTHP